MYAALIHAVAALLPQSRPAVKQFAAPVGRREFVSGAAAAAALLLEKPASAAAPQFFETEGGVKYFDLEVGKCGTFNVACVPQAGDLIKLKYKAYLPSGQMFDSSEGPGRKPIAAKFKKQPILNPGVEEALATMKEGGKRVIQVPPAMAYGDKGIKIDTKDGGSEYLVPPNAKLQYELELLSVAAPPP